MSDAQVQEEEGYDYYPPPSNAVAFSSPLARLGENVIMLTDPSDEIREIELRLRNMKDNRDGTFTRIGEPLLNDEGISSIIGMCKTIVCRNTIMSNLDDRNVSDLMMSLVDALVKDLMVNSQKYEIENIASRDKIWFIVTSTAFVTLKRGYKEGERRFLGKTTQDITHKVDNGRGESWLSKLNPLKR